MDPDARRHAAELLAQYVDKQITNDRLERGWPKSNDPALEAIRLAVWLSYDDERTHFGPLAEAEMIQRCIDYLKTDEEYAWPTPSCWVRILALPLTVLTVGRFEQHLWGIMSHPQWPFRPPK